MLPARRYAGTSMRLLFLVGLCFTLLRADDHWLSFQAGAY